MHKNVERLRKQVVVGVSGEIVLFSLLL